MGVVKADLDRRVSDPVVYYSKSQSFENFLKWTNEKQKIAEAVLKIVGNKKNLLLDIGSGDGTLTNLLAAKFDHVTAIEPTYQLFDTLKKKCCSDKYTLINLPFELATLEKKADIILVSYALQFIHNYGQELLRMKDFLTDSGLLLVIDADQENCEFWQFYGKYVKDIWGANLPNSCAVEFNKMLKTIFKVKEQSFSSTLSIPSVDDAISLLDFIFNKKFSELKQDVLIKIRADFNKRFGNRPINFKMGHIMYVCSK